MSGLKNIVIIMADGSRWSKENVEITFDADNKVIYMYSEEGIAYVNFNHVAQIGIVDAGS